MLLLDCCLVKCLPNGFYYLYLDLVRNAVSCNVFNICSMLCYNCKCLCRLLLKVFMALIWSFLKLNVCWMVCIITWIVFWCGGWVKERMSLKKILLAEATSNKLTSTKVILEKLGWRCVQLNFGSPHRHWRIFAQSSNLQF